MSLATPPRFALTAHNSGHLALASDQGDTAHVFVLENDIIRILVLPDGRLDQPRTFAVAPGAEDAHEARERFDPAGFTLPEFALEADNENLRIETTAIRLKVRLAGFFVRGRCGQEPGGDWWRSTGRPDAQLRMAEFIERCAEHDILCDSFHLPSGYTSIGVHVFSWNRSKFPDPAGLAQSYLAKGIRMCANVKPRLLRDHPLFAEAAASGLLIAAPKGKQSWLGEFEQGDKWSFLGAPPKQGARSLELAHIRTRDNKRRRGRIGLNPEAGRTALKFLNRAGVSMVAVKANEALG